MYAIWTKKDKPGLTGLSYDCLDKECRAIGSLLLHEHDQEERDDLEDRFLQVNELRARAGDGFRVYLTKKNDVLLEPTDGGLMKLNFDTWLCDEIPS